MSTIPSGFSPFNSNTGAPIEQNYSLNPSESDEKECTVEAYLKGLSPSFKKNAERLSRATKSIIDGSKFSGNGVKVASNLLLTSGHCVDLSAKNVVFDGTRCNPRVDFAILYDESADVPVPLAVTPNIGKSLQIYFRVIKDQRIQYAKTFTSVEKGSFASRSDVASVKTKQGESGAPRMSMAGNVHAIHQGGQEALKFNDIYSALESSAEKSSDPQHKNAKTILSQITVVDADMALMTRSSLTLTEGDVSEEKSRIGGNVTVNERVNKKEEEHTFGYSEEGIGRGNRSVKIFLKGKQGSNVCYLITPNPHKNPQYNNEGQPSFYKALAKSVVKDYVSSNEDKTQRAFPNQLTVEILGEDYTITMKKE
jgi:hypothetical protein